MNLIRRGRALAAVLAVYAGLLIVWQLITASHYSPLSLWPPPAVILSELWTEQEIFFGAALTTMYEAALGLLLGMLLAFLTGALSLRFRLLSRSVYGLAVLLYALPIIAIAPLLQVWFGQTLWPKVIIAALGAFFPVTVNTLIALRSADPNALELMALLGASRGQTLWLVRLPYAVPLVLASFKLAAPAAVIGAMLAEWSGAVQGLGVLMLFSMFSHLVPRLWATLVLASALSFLSYYAFERLEDVISWRAAERVKLR
jgi:ABC-type nitrate/sulfonate/bicarbonate transport system permease component